VPAGTRRQARERALGLLYEADAKGISPGTAIEQLPVPPDQFVVDLVLGVERRQAEIDELIARFAVDWALDRMPVVDRTLLRVATYELLSHPEIPEAAVISEAVELAKAYSTDQSGRFVNGVLASVAAQVRGTDPGRSPAAGESPTPG
jgi:N utilization substance protein B